MNEERARVLPVIRALLKPIARICIRYSIISVRDLLELAKRELIDVARDERRKEGKKINISAISAMTGLQRKDVMRIMNLEEDMQVRQTSVIQRVIGQWEQDSRFHNKKGFPKPLTIHGEQNEFRSLVRLISKDLNEGTIAAELERLHLVERKKDKLYFVRGSEKISNDWIAGYSLLAADMDSLAKTVHGNLSADKSEKNLHARTEFDNIYYEDLPCIQEWLLEEGSQFHEKVRNYLAQFDHDINPEREGRAGATVVLGMFSHVEDNRGEGNEKELD